MLYKKILDDWYGGYVCLHPTDTVPGFSFNPNDKEAITRMKQLKGRNSSKNFVSLITNLEVAREFWEPLPPKLEDCLKKFWPGPLSVAWRASKKAPSHLVSDDGYIALRSPLYKINTWMVKVLEQVNAPFPTTSVNISGQPPILSWSEAVSFIQGKDGVSCPFSDIQLEVSGGAKPSTLIKYDEVGGLTMLREGTLSKELLVR